MNQFLAVLLGLSVLVLLIVTIAYLRVISDVNGRVQRDLATWRERDLAALRGQLKEAATGSAAAQLEQWKLDHSDEVRRDAIQKSQATITGKMVEQLVPYFPQFPFNPKDARFIGSPVDFVVFDGLSEDAL